MASNENACHSEMDDEDCHSRIRVAMTVTQNPRNDFLASFVKDTDSAFAAVDDAFCNNNNNNKNKKQHQQQQQEQEGDEEDDDDDLCVAVDEPLAFSQLVGPSSSSAVVAAGSVTEMQVSASDRALHASNEESRKFLSKLNRVAQVSGFSDPIYAEATITIHPFDVVLDIYLVNQSSEMLNNVTVELAATGDLKLCERPQTFLMPPGSAVTTRASMKVSSTETGVIYGTIVFDGQKQDQQYIVLNEIRIDMMEYVKPMTCTSNEFRTMWAEFDWENKVNVNTTALGTDLRGFAEQITNLTNNMCELDYISGNSSNSNNNNAKSSALAAEQVQKSGFLSTSLYARSTFGEHVLANVSVELTETNRVEGVIRIRSKQHGIALALGNRIKARCNNQQN